MNLKTLLLHSLPPTAVPSQVEVDVVADVDHGGTISCRAHFYIKVAFFFQGIFHTGDEVARIPLIS